MTEVFMKQVTIITALLIQTAFAQTGNTKAPEFRINIPADFRIIYEPDIIVSNWFSLSLNQVRNGEETLLEGEMPLESFINNDKKKYIEIVYVSQPGEQGAVVKNLPAKIYVHTQSPDEAFCFRYSIRDGIFKIQVKNPDASTLTPELKTIFSSFRYRYILIPKSSYQQVKADWSNYEAVSLVLNF
jgi:hypothetical protein